VGEVLGKRLESQGFDKVSVLISIVWLISYSSLKSVLCIYNVMNVISCDSVWNVIVFF
jgi:hypothetical protein